MVKVRKSAAAGELDSDSQGLYREIQARRRDSEIAALRTGIRYKAYAVGKLAKGNEALKAAVTRMRKSGGRTGKEHGLIPRGLTGGIISRGNNELREVSRSYSTGEPGRAERFNIT